MLTVNSLFEAKKVCFTLCLTILNELIVKSDRGEIRNMMNAPHKLCEDCFRMKCDNGCVCDCHGTQNRIID